MAQPYRFEATFQYRIDGTRVEVDIDCPLLAICVKPPHMLGRVTEDGIRFDYAVEGRVPQDYVRFEGQ